jgi:cell division septal protein FtsQ
MRNLGKQGSIKSFIISQPFIRLIRAFFYNKILHYLKYSFYLSAIILIIALIYLEIFKESQFKIITNHLIKYSYKIVNFNNINSNTTINIYGDHYANYDEIANLARQYLLNNHNIDNRELLESLKNQIQTLPWVSDVVIGINLQDSLNIHIKEYQPFAIWEDGDKKYIVSKDSKIIAIDDITKFENLVILTGKNAHKNVKSLFNILSIDPDISKNVYSATWIGDRRWDIRFSSGLLVKLPNNINDNIRDAWNSLIQIYNMPGSIIGLKAIDLRITNKIYLEYDEGITKEIKNL